MTIQETRFSSAAWAHQALALSPQMHLATKPDAKPIDRSLAQDTVSFSRRPVSTRPLFGLNAMAIEPAVSFDNTPYGATWDGRQTRYKLWAPRATQVELLKIRPLTLIEEQQRQEFERAEDQRRQLSFEVTMAQRLGSGDTTETGRKRAQLDQLEGKVAELRAKQPDILKDRLISKHVMQKDNRGTFTLVDATGKPDDLYMYRLTRDDHSVTKPLPDMRSRFQPEDVHGPSQVVSNTFLWTDNGFQAPKDVTDLNIYRFHTGVFTQEGKFKSAVDRLDYIKDMGFNAIEIMPIQEFPGDRNWGYDMADLFAVEKSYGKPNDFKNLVNEAHKRGLAVILDVVYNHVGPEGSYHHEYDRDIVAPSNGGWGDTLNYHNAHALDLARDNIAMWIKDYHVDGFRFDMTKYIGDQFTQAMTWHARQIKPDVLLFAEDGRLDDPRKVDQPHDWGGNGFNGQWSFGAHHIINSVISGQSHMDAPTHVGALVDYLTRGTWLPANYYMREPQQNVLFTVSHDEVGNHSGERPITKIGTRKARLASTLKYLMPGIPMNFMGEEYSEKAPFNKFFDHNDPQLIKQMDGEYYRNEEGYRRYWNKPFPQPLYTSADNFHQSKLRWNDDDEANASKALTKDTLKLRKALKPLRKGSNSFDGSFNRERHGMDAWSHPSNVLFMHRWDPANPKDQVLVVVNPTDKGYKVGSNGYDIELPKGRWKEAFNMDDKRYGGHGNTNAAKEWTSGGWGHGAQRHGLNLAPQSALVLHRVAD